MKRKVGARKRPEPLKYKRAKTANGRSIQDLAIKHGWNPSRYKDYVILLGAVMIDWLDRHHFELTNPSKVILKIPMRPILLHKKRLHEVLPAEIASQYWHRNLGCRVSKEGPR